MWTTACSAGGCFQNSTFRGSKRGPPGIAWLACLLSPSLLCLCRCLAWLICLFMYQLASCTTKLGLVLCHCSRNRYLLAKSKPAGQVNNTHEFADRMAMAMAMAMTMTHPPVVGATPHQVFSWAAAIAFNEIDDQRISYVIHDPPYSTSFFFSQFHSSASSS